MVEHIDDVEVLLLAAVLALDDATPRDSRSVGILPRQSWAATVLAEQLLGSLGPSPQRQRLSVLSDPLRGVVPRRVMSRFDRLAIAGYLAPIGVGSSAAWRLSTSQRSNARRLSESIDDPAALRRAAQRTLAILEAWSKTFRASEPATSATSTSAAARLQPLPA